MLVTFVPNSMSTCLFTVIPLETQPVRPVRPVTAPIPLLRLFPTDAFSYLSLHIPQDLCQHTPEDHPDYRILRESLQVMTAFIASTHDPQSFKHVRALKAYYPYLYVPEAVLLTLCAHAVIELFHIDTNMPFNTIQYFILN